MPTSTPSPRAIALCSAIALAWVTLDARASPSLDAYALSAAGQSNFGSIPGLPFSCATFGPDPRTSYFPSVVQVGLPTDGSCGVGVDARSAKLPTGSVTVASNLAVGFGPSTDLKAFVGDSAGRAGFGNLGVHANASYFGSTNSGVVAGAQAFGRQTETMTFGGATGSGHYRPTFTIDGSLFGVGREYSELSFFYSSGTGPVFLAFRILDSYSSISYYGPGGYVSSFPGMTTVGDLATGFTVSGSTSFTLDIPIVFGTASDITFGLWGAVLPSSNVGLLTASAGDVSFMSTAKLTAIEVLGADGKPLPDFSIVSGSGTLYDRNGVAIATPAVPEPETLVLLAVGLAAVGACSARRRRRPSC